MKKLVTAQVGVANFGAYRRARLRETGLFDLVATYDLNAEAMETAREEDGAQPTSSYEELIATPWLEAVVISTGAKFHAEQALAAMDKGLHVFIEKPLCSTPEEMRQLVQKQRDTGVVVGVGHTEHSATKKGRTIKALIDSGELGQLVSVEAITCHSGGMIIKPGDWRGDPEKNPGGMLFQCGVHSLHELMFYFGPIKRVGAMLRYDVNSNTGTADAAVCTLQFESGLIGTMGAFHVTPYRHTMALYGTKANIYLDGHSDATHNVVMQRAAPNYNGAAEHREPLEIRGENDDCSNVRSFYHAIREGGEPTPSLRDGALTVACVFAAEEAAANGKVVDVELP